MKEETAERVCRLMIRVGQDLDQSVKKVHELEGDSEDYFRYRKLVGRLMADMLLSALNPIFDAYPELKPPELR